MIAASKPVKQSPRKKLLVVRADGRIENRPRSALAGLLIPGDLVVANDAATVPASLFGTHERSGGSIEVRLAGTPSLDMAATGFVAVVFGGLVDELH